MSNNIYKIIEVVGTSSNSIEDAIQSAISRASDTLDNLGWFEVVETRGHINKGTVDSYQVIVKLGFTLN